MGQPRSVFMPPSFLYTRTCGAESPPPRWSDECVRFAMLGKRVEGRRKSRDSAKRAFRRSHPADAPLTGCDITLRRRQQEQFGPRFTARTTICQRVRCRRLARKARWLGVVARSRAPSFFLPGKACACCARPAPCLPGDVTAGAPSTHGRWHRKPTSNGTSSIAADDARLRGGSAD